MVDTHQTVAHQPGLPLWGRATVWWCSITFFSFKLPKISLKFMFTPALKYLWLRELCRSVLHSWGTFCVPKRPGSIYQTSYMAPRLRVKMVNFCFCRFSISKRGLNAKNSTPYIEVCPESPGTMLEYLYMKPGLSVKDINPSTARIGITHYAFHWMEFTRTSVLRYWIQEEMVATQSRSQSFVPLDQRWAGKRELWVQPFQECA